MGVSEDHSMWDSMAKLYKEFARDLSYTTITAMLANADKMLPFTQATAILDNGCGPGPVMERLIDDYTVPESCSLTCADFNESMLGQVRNGKEEKLKADPKSPWQRVGVITQDATNLKDFGDASLSHITAGWVYFLTPDPAKCLTESARVLKSGGVLSLSAWEGNQWIKVCECLTELYPERKMPTIPEDWSSPARVHAQLEKAGFQDVVSQPVDVGFKFQKMDEMVEFLISNFPFVTNQVKDLNDEQMNELKAAMYAKGKSYCADEPGVLTGVSIVATGRKP